MVTTVTSKELRGKSDEELAEEMSGWEKHTGNFILYEMEFKRRHSAPNEIRGWISVVLAVIAIMISIIALLSKIHA